MVYIRYIFVSFLQVDDATGTTYTYSQLEELSRKVGSFLYRKGFRKNDVICYYGTNNPEFALLLLGCSSVGVILTTANPAYTSGIQNLIKRNSYFGWLIFFNICLKDLCHLHSFSCKNKYTFYIYFGSTGYGYQSLF